MVARFFVPRDDLLAYRADEWEHQQLTKVADQWERNALQRLDEQFAPPPVAAPAAPADWLQQQQQRLGWSSPAAELSAPFGQATEHVQRLTSQVNPAIAAPAPEPEAMPPPAPAPTRPDLRSLNTTGEQYTPPPEAAPPSTTTAPTPTGNLVDYARRMAQQYGIDPEVYVRQIQQESGFRTDARSPAGATGIAQFMPGTAAGMGVDPTDPYQSLEGGARLMASHLKTYGGDYSKALAAYNAGPGNVQKYGGVPPFEETQRYVKTILGGAGGATPTVSTQDPDKVAAMQSGEWEQVAKAQLGKPYIWGSKGGRSDFSDYAEGFDCSGFVSYVWRNGLGVNMPAFTGDIQKATQGIKSEDAQPGDLVMLMNSSDPTRQHVGIYIGNGQMINSTGGGVQIEPVWNGMEFRRDPRLADRPGSALGILDTASETAEKRPMTPEEQVRGQVAKQSLAPAPETGPLEQITNPFGEAFRQAGQVVSDVGGGALSGIGEAAQAGLPYSPLGNVQRSFADLRPPSETVQRQLRGEEDVQLGPLSIPGRIAGPFGVVGEVTGGPSEAYPSGGPARPLAGFGRVEIGQQQQGRDFEAQTGVPYAEFERQVGRESLAIAEGRQQGFSPETQQLREVWAGIGSTPRAIEAYARAPKEQQELMETQAEIAQSIGSAALLPGGISRTPAGIARAVASGVVDPAGAPYLGLEGLGAARRVGGEIVGRAAEALRPAEAVAEAVPSTRMYHGTGAGFTTPEGALFDPNGLYGPGYYLTSDPRVAGGIVAEGGEQVGPEWLVSSVKRAPGEVVSPGYAQTRMGELAGVAGPNVRAVDVPENLNMLDIEADVSPEVMDAIARLPFNRAAGPGFRDPYADFFDEARRGGWAASGNAAWHAANQRLGNAAATNKFFADMGFDGIKYSGGKRIPMGDAAGRDIAHDVSVVFPESLTRLRNAISGGAGGQASAQLATQLGGAAAGGAAGYATTPEGAPIEERVARTVGGAAAGAGLGYGATRLVPPTAAARVRPSPTTPGGRAALHRLPAEAEAGFAAGMPTGGRPPVPPPGGVVGAAEGVFGTPTGPVGTANIIATPNYKRLQAMRGTPEQAAELAPERPGFAGNINLDKITPDDVKTALTQAAEENNLFAGQRRGVITDPEARQNAARVALNMAPEDWIKTKPGRAFNQEEALALGETMVRTGNEYTTMRAALDAAEETGEATDLMRAATADKALEMALLEGVRSGAASEAGRALRSFRQALEGALRNKANDPGKAFSAALKAIGTDEARYAEWVKAWDAIPADNVVGKYQLLQALHKPTVMNKIVAFTTSNMLSGNKTLEVNLVGGAMETINRPLIELLGGRPVDAWTDLTAMGRAVGQGFANAGTAFTTGVRPSQAARTLAEGKYDNIRPDAFGGKSGMAWTPALRANVATDEFIRTLNSAGGLAVAARREARATGKTVQEILSQPPEHVLKFAQDAADASVLEGARTPFSKGVGAWRNLVNSSNPAEQAVGVTGHVLFPFVNIPEQILVRGGRMLPGLNEASTIMQIRKGMQAGDQQVVRDAVGRYVLTNGVLLATGSQVLAGNITGNGPKDAQKRAALEAARDENGNKIWQAHSIKVGDRWLDYTNLGPVAIPMATLSNAHEAYLESGKKPGATEVVDVFNRVADTMLDASYIRSFGEVMKAIGEGNAYKAGGSLIGNTATRFVPVGGALASAARITEQETKQPTNLPEYIMSRIPDVPGFGAPSPFPISSRVPDKPSPFGGTIQQPQDVAAIVSPFRTSATGEPEPLARAFVEAGMGVPTAPATISMKNQATGDTSPPMALTDDEKRQYMQLMGDRLRENAQASLNSPKWQQEAAALRAKPPDTWTPADQQIAESHKGSLERMTEAAREYAKAQLFQSWTPEERQRRMAEGTAARRAEPILGR